MTDSHRAKTEHVRKGRQDRDHTCHARGCDKSVPPAMFMCKPHWFMLPKATRDEVWLAYAVGQELRLDPSDEYMQVTQDAIEWIAAKESHSGQQPSLLDGGIGPEASA